MYKIFYAYSWFISTSGLSAFKDGKLHNILARRPAVSSRSVEDSVDDYNIINNQ